jgi:DNA-directed RNA polymerase specialized sigma subunit
MMNYRESDYALNKYSDGIVYRFADSIVVITLSDYLAENPGKAEADFLELKKMSDRDYLRKDRSDNAQTKKNDTLDEAALNLAPSPEETLINKIDEREEVKIRRQRLGKAYQALDRLTEVQRRRYLLYHVKGKTIREIADIEGVFFTSVHECLQAAEKKIKKFLKRG